MSKIPYHFHTPIPKYFWDTGYLDLKKKSFLVRFSFLHWAFGKCRKYPYEEIVDGIKVLLQPWEFVFQREKSAIECGLTEKQARNQLEEQKGQLNVQKRANSRANRFTVYMWVTDRFCKNEGQPKDQPKGQLNGQAPGEDIHIVIDDRYIENHHHIDRYPDLIDDDFSSKMGTGPLYDLLKQQKLLPAHVDELLNLFSKEQLEKKILQVQESRKQVSSWFPFLKKCIENEPAVSVFDENKVYGNELIQALNFPGVDFCEDYQINTKNLGFCVRYLVGQTPEQIFLYKDVKFMEKVKDYFKERDLKIPDPKNKKTIEVISQNDSQGHLQPHC